MTALAQPATIVGEQPTSLARFRAERRAEEIRSDLKGAAAMLREARDEEDWRQLGHVSHGAYVLARFGDVLEDLKLATEDRDAVVDAMRTDGASYKKIERRLGISAGTVRNILDRVGDHAPDKIVGDDGRTRAARTRVDGGDETPAASVATTVTVADRTVQLVAAAGPRGLTVKELCRKARVHHGQASGALSRVHRQGRVTRSVIFRDGCAAYVVESTS